MVIKGSARGDAAGLAAHLLRADTNERVAVLELRGVMADELRGALEDMELIGSGARTRRPFYHALINTAPDERLTEEQRTHALDRLEQELGLTGQPRAVVEHEKEGRTHFHVVWSRIDLDRMTAIPDSHNFRRHEIVARELEREFGHDRVQGAHVERDGKDRPDRTPSHAEMQQAERTGRTPQEAREEITALWRSTDSGRAFTAALEGTGWILAQGEKRAFVLIDPDGETHSLARRVEGAKAKDVRARMADLDPAMLPNISQAKALAKQRGIAHEMPQLELPSLSHDESASDRRDQDEREARKRLDGEQTLAATSDGGMVAQQREAMAMIQRRTEAKQKLARELAEAARLALERQQDRGRSR